MVFIKSILRAFFTCYVFILFLAFLLLIFPLVIIASFFGKIKGGNFIYMLCKLWSHFVLFMAGIYVRRMYEAPIVAAKQYVFVFNHISYLDIPIIMKAIPKQHFRVLGKAELAKIPIFGFLYKNAVVSVDRTNVANRAKSVVQLKAVLRKGISIVVSPEGTFNMTHHPLKEFYDGAFKVAIETQTPIKPMLFLDAYDRLSYQSVFSLNPGECRIVYLDEIKVDGLTINDVKKLKEEVYKKMEEGLIQYKATWIKQ
jgi:1-acyl-sn-glycerol-3-phosphate acyltransferase